ncbi:kinase-like protein [Glonium stellatum]|uniref:Kinase-like protein n=1 Tax=Glonium stellatum TaxID=574774 RepID=A0A8E2JYU3_9PEZI|nr:kinase-like protein [Glonium stellatum]
MSAPEVRNPHQESHSRPVGGGEGSSIPLGSRQVDYGFDSSEGQLPLGEPPPLSTTGEMTEHDGSSEGIDEHLLQQELEAKWILNLSMHFRDMSDREKFFITYAEEPNKWRRVTVSCDYRDVPPESLEADLKSLHYQRDKSARIYESIRDSLPDIQFYDTVTNLKLQTDGGRLHVHVTEDVNEIIPYPSMPAVQHLSCPKFRESTLRFESHISGFVYKITVGGKMYIKKEIPGPDAVEEFLYEINALCSLRSSKSVIKFEGVIVDDKDELIKGLLISYADQGALVDLIYDWKNSDKLPWERRERWAKQIVQGLSEIHEAGFVQGDFTLSNIVIDDKDDAKIIDINRRGCPVGWEPPELAKLIENGQRISIYIGVKSDLFQLGMVLWALAEQQDEPERQERPLTRTLGRSNHIPQYFQDIIIACLSNDPSARFSAKDLLAKFPECISDLSRPLLNSRHSMSTHRSDKEYIDPATAISIDDVSNYRHPRPHAPRSPRSSMSAGGITFAEGAPSTEYQFGSSGSYILPNPSRGRSTSYETNSQRQYEYSPYAAPRSIRSLDSELENELASLPASRETRWEQIYIDGDMRLVQRRSLGMEGHGFAGQDGATICLTTPPGELEESLESSIKSSDTPLQLSAALAAVPAELQSPATPPSRLRHMRNASFSDRVHRLVRTEDSTLAELEDEVGRDVFFSEPESVESGMNERPRFSPPIHQDSGFNEPIVGVGAFAVQAANVRQGLETTGIPETHGMDDTAKGTEWADKFPIVDARGVGYEREKVAEEKQAEKPVDERFSTAGMRPPSIIIPQFHHQVPTAIESKENNESYATHPTFS